MNLIQPFHFRQMFGQARSFAIVGNAPSILEYENGPTIDTCDVVVRFNRATTQGLEAKIGHRTDILVVNASNSKKLGPPPTETVRPKCLVSYVSPQGVPTVDPTPFAEWIGEVPILLTFGPDPFGLPATMRTRPLTSGTYFLCMLLRMLTVERLFVTGFTMFGAVPGGSTKYYRDDRPGLGTFHDLDVESRLFGRLLGEFPGELTLTPEVADLVGLSGSDAPTANTAVGAARSPHSSLRKRIAEGMAWRVLNLGMRLRRLAETR